MPDVTVTASSRCTCFEKSPQRNRDVQRPRASPNPTDTCRSHAFAAARFHSGRHVAPYGVRRSQVD